MIDLLDAHGIGLWVGDCRDHYHCLADGSVALIFADLPFGKTNAPWDQVVPFDTLWPHWERILRPDGVVLLCGDDLFAAAAKLSNPKRRGAANQKLYKYTWYWEKSKAPNFLNASKQPMRCVEEIVAFYGKQPTYHPQMRPGKPYDKGIRKASDTEVYNHFEPTHVKNETGERYPRNLLDFPTAESEGPVWNGTQKPIAMADYFLRTYTNPGDLVVDPVCGAGTTLVAADRLGRRAIGMDLRPEQIGITRWRLELDRQIRAGLWPKLSRDDQMAAVAHAAAVTMPELG